MCYTLTMKTNITLKVDAELAREARILAAKRGLSLSRMVSEELEQLVDHDRIFEQTRKRALRRLRQGYELAWRKPADRDELHER